MPGRYGKIFLLKNIYRYIFFICSDQYLNFTFDFYSHLIEINFWKRKKLLAAKVKPFSIRRFYLIKKFNLLKTTARIVIKNHMTKIFCFRLLYNYLPGFFFWRWQNWRRTQSYKQSHCVRQMRGSFYQNMTKMQMKGAQNMRSSLKQLAKPFKQH